MKVKLPYAKARQAAGVAAKSDEALFKSKLVKKYEQGAAGGVPAPTQKQPKKKPAEIGSANKRGGGGEGGAWPCSRANTDPGKNYLTTIP